MLSVYNFILSVFFPPRCPVCDGVLPRAEREARIHTGCYPKLERIPSPYCLRCGCPLHSEEAEYCSRCEKTRFHFIRNFPLWTYNEAARRSVALFKYHGRQDLARFYAEEYVKFRGEELKRFGAEALIPVPIHKSRLRKRGYNQAALFAAELSRLTGIPLRTDLLLRRKHTDAQKSLGREERFRNMRRAFAVTKKALGLHRVLLVDDIYTTGSTLEACSLALSEAGIPLIACLTLCVVEGE